MMFRWRHLPWRIPNARHFSFSACNRAPPSQNIVTYNPNLMQEKKQAISNISDMPTVTLRLGTKLRPRFSHHLHYSIDYHPGVFMYRKPPFPANIKGFFYYFRDESMPAISGSLRFRICQDLSAFDSGHDLLTEMGEPWAVPLIRMVRDKVWSYTLGYLVRDGQVNEGLVRSIKKLQLPQRTLRYRPIFLPTQPFSFNLKHRLLALNLVTSVSTTRVDFQHLFSDKDRPPVEGIVKLAFELVNPEPADGPTLVLRILDVVRPIKCPEGAKYVTLEAGQLLQRWTKDRPQTWTYCLGDRPNGAVWLKFIKETNRWL